ncbi:MAG TPA: ABC transporter permease [Candidatus Eisenbacteria bacterium]
MGRRFALLRALGLRPLRRHAGRTLLTLLGVAAGVAVYVGIDLAAESSIRSFSTAARAVAGGASLRIHHRPLALPESLLLRLRPFEGKADLMPTLEALARAHEADGPAFTILGVDLIGDPRVRGAIPWAVGAATPAGGAGPTAGGDPLVAVRALFDPGTLYVPAPLADQLEAGRPSGATRSDSITAVVGTRPYRFRIARIAPPPGSETSVAAPVAFLDLAPFQERFGRIGELDWIDVEPRSGVDPDSLRREIAARLANDVRIEPPEERARMLERMLGSYRRNLRALSLISLVVGMLLAYNALLSTVLQRRSEISLLRALGAGRALVAALIGVEGWIVGLLGGVLGVLLGRGLAEGALALVSRTVSDLYARSSPMAPRLTAGEWALGVSLGVASAAVAAYGPVREALRVRPLEFAREEHPDAPESDAAPRRLLVAAAAATLALWLIAHPRGIGEGVRGYVGAAAALLAGTLAARPFFTAVARLARAPLRRLWSPAGRLAAATAIAARRRLSVSVAALLLSYAIVWGMASLVESFRVTVDAWAGSTLRADLWITPQSRAGSPAEGTMPASWSARLAALPEVADVDAFRVREIAIGGDLCFLGAGRSDVLARHGFLPLVDRRDAAPLLRRLPNARLALVSEPLARRRRLAPGMRLSLDTPTGRHDYGILAVYRDYSSDRGYVILDRTTYRADFGDSLVSTYALYLKPGIPRSAGAAAAARAVGPGELIRVTDTRTIREEVRRVMRRTFAVTDALEIVAAAVALLSVLGTLAALVLTRRREIGALRAIGASRLQVVRALLLEAALLALSGLLLGALTGCLLGGVLVHVLNRESFGWTLALAMPWRRTAILAAALFVAALLAALPPARRAAAVPPREAMSRA